MSINKLPSKDLDSSELSLDWLIETEKITQINENYHPELMTTIQIHYIYINVNSYIEKIKSDTLSISDTKITSDQLMELSEKNRKVESKQKYNLVDVFIYNVDLPSENIQEYVKNANSNQLFKTFFKSHNITDDMNVHPSIFIFHSINSIYFIYQERELDLTQEIKPILKIGKPNDNPKKHSTKRVSINVKQQRNTRKIKNIT